MNKQPSSTLMTRLCWGVFFLALLFLAFQVMPLALGQSRNGAGKQTMAASMQMPQVVQPATGAVSRRPAVPALPASQLPKATSGPAGAHVITVPPAPQAPQVILYDQYNNAGTNATSSQDFEASLDAFDDELADDFVVAGGQSCSV